MSYLIHDIIDTKEKGGSMFEQSFKNIDKLLRKDKGLSTEIDYVSSNLKPQFKLSERVNAPYIIIIGSDEVENGVF